MKEAAQLLTKIEAASLLAGFVVLAACVWLYQNRGERLGGGISAIKAVWLSYAIVLWIGLPVVLIGEGAAFLVLAISMVTRAVLEVPLCWAGRWRVAYGVGHDLVHAALLIFLMGWAPVPGLGVWGALTLMSLASELIFVRWFIKATGGPDKGVFFVPGGQSYRAINIGTAIIFIPQGIGFVTLLMMAMASKAPVV